MLQKLPEHLLEQLVVPELRLPEYRKYWVPQAVAAEILETLGTMVAAAAEILEMVEAAAAETAETPGTTVAAAAEIPETLGTAAALAAADAGWRCTATASGGPIRCQAGRYGCRTE